MKVSGSHALFFFVVGIMYCFTFIATRVYTCNLNSTKSKSMLVLTGMIFGLVVFGYAALTDVFSESEKWEVSPAKQCSGGAYMMQGNSTRAKMCRNLYKNNPEEIHQLNCGSGFIGMPKNKFEYTTLSNDKWKNERCDKPITYSTEYNGIF
jgi:hypothetical protein